MFYDGDGFLQYDVVIGEFIVICGSEGFDYVVIMDYVCWVGGFNLWKMIFCECGQMFKKLVFYLYSICKKYYLFSYCIGVIKGDSWIDIDGGIGILFVYVSLCCQFLDKFFYIDGEVVGLFKEGMFIGYYIMVFKYGVVVYINVFNFFIWGMLEKFLVNLLAGVFVVVKFFEIMFFFMEVMVCDIIDFGILLGGVV